jgi:hypothetical protein
VKGCKKQAKRLLLFRKKEATRGFEPLMRVLQTLALPLGHVAWGNTQGFLIPLWLNFIKLT